ncbi:hypothetical protein NQ317_006294 [Molorchus minor]|uniref:Uncharacterized protein n=1 Tax=Molorchus minor TaxID=1323400 RepID=A0ABQ9JF14_9CUCU|nr:hypothetical protein NQ317_006294 [Molorchus minor]
MFQQDTVEPNPDEDIQVTDRFFKSIHKLKFTRKIKKCFLTCTIEICNKKIWGKAHCQPMWIPTTYG